MTSNIVEKPTDVASGTVPSDPPLPGALSRLISLAKRPYFWVLGFNPPDFVDPRVREADLAPDPAHVRYADMIAKQIEVEQGLSNTRMMWNLTFQGFTIAGYALVASSEGATPKKFVLETLIAIASGVIAYATLRGVVASQIQRQYLKDCWARNKLDRFFPQPFSITTTSSRGRLPSYSICMALMLMWATLFGSQFFEGDEAPVTYVQMVPAHPHNGAEPPAPVKKAASNATPDKTASPATAGGLTVK